MKSTLKFWSCAVERSRIAGRYKHLRARTYFSAPLRRKDNFQRLPYAAQPRGRNKRDAPAPHSAKSPPVDFRAAAPYLYALCCCVLRTSPKN
jgi:hypothetical protein